MRIVQVYSHVNGQEYILFHRPGVWSEIEQIIAGVHAVRRRTKRLKEKSMRGELLYSPIEMNRRFAEDLRSRGWTQSRISYWVTADQRLVRATIELSPGQQRTKIEQAGETPIGSYNRMDFVKDRIAVEVRFGRKPFASHDLFVKHMAFYVGDVIDVGVEILAMKELQTKMSPGVAYYEDELYDILRHGSTVPAVPLVLIGIAP